MVINICNKFNFTINSTELDKMEVKYDFQKFLGNIILINSE